MTDQRSKPAPAEPSGKRGYVLVVEDEEIPRSFLERALTSMDFRLAFATTGEAALRALEAELFDIVLLDLQLPGIGGLELLAVGPALQTDAQFIVATGEASVDRAIEAMKLGAFDYLRKPINLQELRLTLERALDERERRRELANLRSRAGATSGGLLIGRSPAIQRLTSLIARVAPTRATVLITGETGTGKELVAQTVHAMSDRARKPFVPVHCSALPETLLESELFGHVKGAFTGAVDSRRGLVETAAEGTLFLDEVGTIPPATQVKLLRVLQERRVTRLGSSEPLVVTFRLVAASNVDLAQEVAQGRFREDLFYRLNVFPLPVPPLRERKSDIPLLVAHFVSRFAQENGFEPPEIPPDLIRRMMEYDWPGNVRELENFVQRSLIMHSGAKSVPTNLPLGARPTAQHTLLETAVEHAWSLERLEREYILQVLERTRGHQSRAAEILGIDRRTLYRKLKSYVDSGLLEHHPADPVS
jgi:two-component system response regulator HydG